MGGRVTYWEKLPRAQAATRHKFWEILRASRRASLSFSKSQATNEINIVSLSYLVSTKMFYNDFNYVVGVGNRKQD